MQNRQVILLIRMLSVPVRNNRPLGSSNVRTNDGQNRIFT
jgi:hypothetical protein